MSVNLVKGQKISLTKTDGGLKKVMVGLGWDEAQQTAKGLKALFVYHFVKQGKWIRNIVES